VSWRWGGVPDGVVPTGYPAERGRRSCGSHPTVNRAALTVVAGEPTASPDRRPLHSSGSGHPSRSGNQKKHAVARFLKPSAGLEPATPSLPSSVRCPIQSTNGSREPNDWTRASRWRPAWTGVVPPGRPHEGTRRGQPGSGHRPRRRPRSPQGQAALHRSAASLSRAAKKVRNRWHPVSLTPAHSSRSGSH
jgi:hypothetical protein